MPPSSMPPEASSASWPVLGYAATRLVAFPELGDDVGNWLEPLGVIAVASELAVVFCALAALLDDIERRERAVKLR